MMRERINSDGMKDRNRALILSCIRSGDYTRADVARLTGLTRAGVTIITDGLKKEGILTEGETVRGKVGRSGTVLRFTKDRYYVVGVALRRDEIAYGKADLDGVITERGSFPIDETTPREIALETLRPRLLSLMQDERKLIGIGIVAPGPVDADSGVILTPPRWKEWQNFHAVEYFANTYGVPAYVENESGALAVAEFCYGIGKKLDTFVEFDTDTGLGSGVVLGGRQYRGAGGMGVELGHVTVNAEGPACDCGNVGCAELYASLPALLSYAKEKNPAFTDWKTVADACEGGDPDATAVLDRAAEYLSVVAVSAMNAFDLKNVVVLGQITYRFSLLKERLQRKIESRILAKGSPVGVYASDEAEVNHVRAGACVALNHFFRFL